jgi:di/tricarboxylate transporter
VLPRTRRLTQSAAIIEKYDEDRKYLRDIFGLHNNRPSGLLYMAAFALAILLPASDADKTHRALSKMINRE